MRFLSLAVLSGCALVDASKDPHGGTVGSGGDLTFEVVPVAGINPNVTQLITANLDDVPPIDLLILSQSNMIALVSSTDAGFLPVQIEAGYEVIGAGQLDGGGQDELIGAASGGGPVLDIFTMGAGGYMRSQQHPGEVDGMPKQIIVGTFPFLGPAGGSIVMSFTGRNMVRVVADATSGTPLRRDIATNIEPFDLAVGDVAQDTPGTDHLLIAAQTLVEVKPDVSNSTFAAPELRTYAVPAKLTTGRFSDAAHDDLAYARTDIGPDLVYILGGPAGLPDQQLDPVAVGPTDLNVGTLVTGDFNGDGLDDVAAMNIANHTIHIFTTVAQGMLTVRSFQVGGEINDVKMAAGDFDGDGTTDLAVAPGASGGGVDLLLSR